MKKIIKENFYIKNSKGDIIDANTFAQNISSIDGDVSKLDSEQAITKHTGLPRDEIKNSMNKLLQAFIRKVKYDTIIKWASKNEDTFSKIFFNQFSEFIDKDLQKAEGTDEYYSKYSDNAEFMKTADDKIWNNSMNEKEKQDWARVWLGLKPTAPITPDAAEMLFKFRYDMMHYSRSNISEEDIINTLKAMSPSTAPATKKEK